MAVSNDQPQSNLSTAGDDLDLPPGLAKRPVDPKRGLPIPVMNMPVGELDPSQADFTAINAVSVYTAATNNLCGICGNTLGYWFAFIGGPKSYEHRSYVDPPFCLDCAEASLRLCPHMAIPRHKRAPEHRLAEDAHTPAGFVEAKPEAIVMGITRSFELLDDGRGGMYFRAAPFKRSRVFRYVNDVLSEVDE